MALEQEEWRAVVGYEGLYEVSNQGRVRGVERRIVRSDGVEQVRLTRILDPVEMPSGHLRLGLSSGGRTRGHLVHRLVCEAFNGPAPEGKPLVLHRDDVPSNNNPGNLYWGDYKDNRRDLYRNRPPRNFNAEKTECSRGHAFSQENTYWTRGRRQCLQCRKIHEETRKMKRRGSDQLHVL